LLGKPILDGDVLPFNPSEFAQLLAESLHEDRATRSDAWIQVTDAKNFSRLLRRHGRAKRKEHRANREESQYGIFASRSR
jgi:putative heme degradation protein